ncbi:MAG: flavodoxin domain-containing protein [Candidatus Bathyarchaeia archaeon]
MSRALVVYGTRYGAAASTSEEIAKVFRQEGIETQIVDARKEKVKDINGFDLIVVGSGIQINRWTSQPEDFIKKHIKEFAGKKLALFVCCGSASSLTGAEAEKMKDKYLTEKAVKYGLEPVALGFFGGVYNFNKVPWWAKRALDAERPKVEAAAKQVEHGVYDTRDWNAIRIWAKELTKKTF